jgi:MoaA/NifB/PqqE/SkfB family radical SAM enzyme
MRDCKALGISVHGTFMLGLPGENRNTIQQTINFAREIDPDTIQVSIAAPYPGTELYKQAADNGWLNDAKMVTRDGAQTCVMTLEGIDSQEALASVDKFYRQFYFRPSVIMRMGGQMLANSDLRKRRLREGREFVSFLHRNEHSNDQKSVGIKRILRDGGPGFCQFAVTDACNASCAFCNFRKEYDTGKQRSFVDLHESCAAIDIMAANGIEYISFIGGEPTLHPGLPDIISHAKLHKMHTMICTNGWLLTPERIGEYADAGLDSCIISIDAPTIESHEANRGLNGLCARIADANASLKKERIPTTASITMSKLLGNIAELPVFLTSLGFSRATFSYPLQTLDSSFRGCAESELVQYTPNELLSAFQDIIRLKKSFSLVNPKASLQEMQRFVRGEKQIFPCLAGYKYFYLDWNFDMYRCHAWQEPMCSIWDFDQSKTVRDGCTKCMIDCYRDASVLQHIAIALHDAGKDMQNLHVGKALKKLLNRGVYESAKSVLEERVWIRGL